MIPRSFPLDAFTEAIRTHIKPKRFWSVYHEPVRHEIHFEYMDHILVFPPRLDREPSFYMIEVEKFIKDVESIREVHGLDVLKQRVDELEAQIQEQHRNEEFRRKCTKRRKVRTCLVG